MQMKAGWPRPASWGAGPQPIGLLTHLPQNSLTHLLDLDVGLRIKPYSIKMPYYSILLRPYIEPYGPYLFSNESNRNSQKIGDPAMALGSTNITRERRLCWLMKRGEADSGEINILRVSIWKEGGVLDSGEQIELPFDNSIMLGWGGASGERQSGQAGQAGTKPLAGR